MLNWFSGQSENKTNDKEEDSEDDNTKIYDSDDDVYIPKYDILWTRGNNTFATIKINDFIRIPCWAYNRHLDYLRVKQLEKGILESQYVHGIFTIARKEDKMYIIDGQHRHRALQNLYENKDNISVADIPIIISIYDLNNDAEIVELFKKVNNTKPLDPKETPDAVIINVVNELGKQYPKAIHFDRNKTVYPYILAKELQEKIRTINIENITTDMLLKEIRKLNFKWSTISPTKIPNVKTPLTQGAVNKARTSGFYLGLDTKFSWVEALEENLNFK